MYSDIMENSRRFDDIYILGRELFGFGNCFCKGIYLHEMGDPAGVGAVVFAGFCNEQ